MIELRKPAEIEKLRKSNQIVAKTLDYLEKHAKENVSLKELDELAYDFILSFGARPSFKGLYGFPGSVCTSLNHICIHGIPDERILKNGDILGIDVGVFLDGYYGDAARTIAIGQISKQDEKLIQCAKNTLYEAIDAICAGMRFKELSYILEQSILKHGFVPLKGYCGHGIGTKPHCEPEIANYLEQYQQIKSGPKIKDSMVFCIEPMVCQKDGTPKHYDGSWGAGSIDGLNCSHYEHCVAIVGSKAEILSLA